MILSECRLVVQMKEPSYIDCIGGPQNHKHWFECHALPVFVILMKDQGYLHWMVTSLEQENNEIFKAHSCFITFCLALAAFALIDIKYYILY